MLVFLIQYYNNSILVMFLMCAAVFTTIRSSVTHRRTDGWPKRSFMYMPLVVAIGQKRLTARSSRTGSFVAIIRSTASCTFILYGRNPGSVSFCPYIHALRYFRRPTHYGSLNTTTKKAYHTCYQYSSQPILVMNTNERTEVLLYTRRVFAEKYEAYGKNPSDYLVSADHLRGTREQRVARLYDELRENVEYFPAIASRIGYVPKQEPELRTYHPSEDDMQLLESLAEVSVFHEIQRQAARRPHHATRVKSFLPEGEAGYGTACGIFTAMTLSHNLEWRVNQESVVRSGKEIPFSFFNFKDGEITMAVSQYLTYFKPYPPISDEGWLPGFLRLHTPDWGEEVITFCPWTLFALEWAEHASVRYSDVAVPWPLRIDEIAMQYGPQLNKAVAYSKSVTYEQDRARTADDIAFTDGNVTEVVNLNCQEWIHNRDDRLRSVLRCSGLNPLTLLRRRPIDRTNQVFTRGYPFTPDHLENLQYFVNPSENINFYRLLDEDRRILNSLAPFSPFHEIMQQVHITREGLNAVRIVYRCATNQEEIPANVSIIEDTKFVVLPGFTILNSEGDKIFLEDYEHSWHTAKPGLYYGLRTCNERPGPLFFPEEMVVDAICQYFMFFNVFPKDIRHRDEPFILGFPLIKFEGIVPNVHTVRFFPWSSFAVSWYDDYLRFAQSDQQLPTHNGWSRIHGPASNVLPDFPGVLVHQLYDSEVSDRANDAAIRREQTGRRYVD